jgi:hypothetical protein
VAFLIVYLLVIFVLSLGLIISAWPNAERVPSWLGAVSAELRYVILVASGGALGAAVHASSSLADKIGNRTFVKGWLLWYVLRVLIGIPMGMVFYLLIRGLLLAPQADVQLNPYGILATSVLVGMFSTQALDKLNTVFSALLRPTTGLEKQIDRLGEALGVATLDNYQGFVCLSFRDMKGNVIFFSEGARPWLNPGEHYELIAWFQPDRPEESLAKEVRIAGGSDAKIIEFKLIPDSDSISLLPSQETVTFPPKNPSSRVIFTFQAPEDADPYDLWVEVFQKNRLIQVITASVNIMKPRGE